MIIKLAEKAGFCFGVKRAVDTAFEKAEEAKRMLRYTEKPISDISSDLGFSSQSHLIRVFRKLEGITPKEYRNKFNM